MIIDPMLLGVAAAGTGAASLVAGGTISLARSKVQRRDREQAVWFEIQLSEIERPPESIQSGFVNIWSSLSRGGWRRFLYGSMGFRIFFVGSNKSVKMYCRVPNERKFQTKQMIESIYSSSFCTELEESPLTQLVSMDGFATAMKARKESAPFQPFTNKTTAVLDWILGILKQQDEPMIFELALFPDSSKKLRKKEGDLILAGFDPDKIGTAIETGINSLSNELLGKNNMFQLDSGGAKSLSNPVEKNAEMKKLMSDRGGFSQRAFQVVLIGYAKGKNAKSRLSTLTTAFANMHLMNSFKTVKRGKKLIPLIHSGKYPESIKSLLATSELTHLLQIPHREFRSWPMVQEVKKIPAPEAMFLEYGLRIGISNASGSGLGKVIRLGPEAYLSHGFLEAQPGAGKTNELGVMMKDLMDQQLLELQGKYKPKTARQGIPGFTMFDPHSDCIEKMMTHLPPELYERTYYIKMSDRNFPRAFNVFDMDSLEADSIADIFVKSMMDLYPVGSAVRMENFLKNGTLTLLKSKEEVTALHIPLIFTNATYREKILKSIRHRDPFQMEFWNGSFEAESGNIDKVMGPIWNRLNNLISFDIMRNMFGQTKSFINIRQMMDEGHNLLIDAADVGPDNMKLMAAWLLIQFHFTAKSRNNIPEKDRRGHLFFGDECHGWLCQVVANIIDEDRKYGLGIWMATQYSDQITNQRLKDSILKNVGNQLTLRSKHENAVDVGRRLGIRAQDIINLPDNQGYGQVLVEEGFSKTPYTISFENPYLSNGNYEAKPFKDRSNQRDGRPIKDVEAEMLKRYQLSDDDSPVPSQKNRKNNKRVMTNDEYE